MLDSEQEVKELSPDIQGLSSVDTRGVIVTARGSGNIDFVSRFFCPATGINEDPVTGSAHCALIPFWAERLGKRQMIARQISQRGGLLHCELSGERINVGGRAVSFLCGEIWL